jgi:flagellar basal body-associated protein FliL
MDRILREFVMQKIFIVSLLVAACISSCAMLSNQNNAPVEAASDETSMNDTNYQIMMKEQEDRMHTHIRHGL